MKGWAREYFKDGMSTGSPGAGAEGPQGARKPGEQRCATVRQRPPSLAGSSPFRRPSVLLVASGGRPPDPSAS